MSHNIINTPRRLNKNHVFDFDLKKLCIDKTRKAYELADSSVMLKSQTKGLFGVGGGMSTYQFSPAPELYIQTTEVIF